MEGKNGFTVYTGVELATMMLYWHTKGNAPPPFYSSTIQAEEQPFLANFWQLRPRGLRQEFLRLKFFWDCSAHNLSCFVTVRTRHRGNRVVIARAWIQADIRCIAKARRCI